MRLIARSGREGSSAALSEGGSREGVEDSDAPGFTSGKGLVLHAAIAGINSKRVISLPEIRMELAKPFVRGAENSMRADGLRYLSWGGAWTLFGSRSPSRR